MRHAGLETVDIGWPGQDALLLNESRLGISVLADERHRGTVMETRLATRLHSALAV